MTATEPQIDFTRIEFPTDKLTIKDLRKTDPEAFDVEPAKKPGRPDHLWPRPLHRMSLDTLLAATLDSERILAEMAFKTALGQPVKITGMGDREVIFENLGSDYVSLGVAGGEHEAHEMLRGIEAQAVAQARQHGGRPR
jgi:hypothetical protein